MLMEMNQIKYKEVDNVYYNANNKKKNKITDCHTKDVNGCILN